MPHIGFGPLDPRPRLEREEASCDPFDPDYNPGDPRCVNFNPFTDTRFDPFPGCDFGEEEGPDGLCYTCGELGMVENEDGECVVHPSDTTFVIDVSDCEQRGGRVEDGRCVLPETDIGPVFTGPLPRVPPRSRGGASPRVPRGVPLPKRLPGRRRPKPCPEGEKRDPETGECITTFEAEGTACPDDKVLVNGVCVDPSTPTDEIPGGPPPVPDPGDPPEPPEEVEPIGDCPDPGETRDEDGNCGPPFKASVCIPPKVKVPDPSAPGGFRCEDIGVTTDVGCQPGWIRVPTDNAAGYICLPPVVPPPPPPPPVGLCPDGTPVPLTGTCPSNPRRPGIPSLNLSGLVAPGLGSGLSFLSPINVGASPGDTLFPAQQAVPEVPGTLMQFLASLAQR